MQQPPDQERPPAIPLPGSETPAAEAADQPTVPQPPVAQPDQPSAAEPTQTPAASLPTAPAAPPAPPPEVGTPPVESGLTLPEPVFTPFSLTVGDGFKFGCGLAMSLTIALLIGLLLISLVLLAASLVGLSPLPVGR
jgi:hypothetical protein